MKSAASERPVFLADAALASVPPGTASQARSKHYAWPTGQAILCKYFNLNILQRIPPSIWLARHSRPGDGGSNPVKVSQTIQAAFRPNGGCVLISPIRPMGPIGPIVRNRYSRNCALNFALKLALLTGGRGGPIRRAKQNMLRHASFSDE